MMDEDQCGGYGFRYGTSEFARCMQRTDINRAAERRESMRELSDALERDRERRDWEKREEVRDRRLDKYLNDNSKRCRYVYDGSSERLVCRSRDFYD